MELTIAFTIAAVLVAFVGIGLAIVARCYVPVPANSALVVTSQQGVRVLRRGGLYFPLHQRAELLDLGVRTIEVRRAGREGIVCRDGIRVDVTASFTLGVRDTEESIRKVAETVGCARAGDPEVLHALFAPRLEDALRQVLRDHDYERALSLRAELRDRILEVLGELDGFEVRAVGLGALEITPLAQLDPDNILDAQGLRRITEIASQAKLATIQLQHELLKATSDVRVEAQTRAYAELVGMPPP